MHLYRLGLAACAAGILLCIVQWPGVDAAERCAGQLVRASWYGAESGNRTASGMAFDGSQWIVAHKTLPFGTRLRLSYRGKSVTVTVQDRGPFIKGRTLDLSHAVAKALGTVKAGIVTICMERL